MKELTIKDGKKEIEFVYFDDGDLTIDVENAYRDSISLVLAPWDVQKLRELLSVVLDEEPKP